MLTSFFFFFFNLSGLFLGLNGAELATALERENFNLVSPPPLGEALLCRQQWRYKDDYDTVPTLKGIYFGTGFLNLNIIHTFGLIILRFRGAVL